MVSNKQLNNSLPVYLKRNRLVNEATCLKPQLNNVKRDTILCQDGLHAIQLTLDLVCDLPQGACTFGISCYGRDVYLMCLA